MRSEKEFKELAGAFVLCLDSDINIVNSLMIIMGVCIEQTSELMKHKNKDSDKWKEAKSRIDLLIKHVQVFNTIHSRDLFYKEYIAALENKLSLYDSLHTE